MPEISIIEDDIQFAEMLAEIGEMAGYEVKVFTEAGKFLDQYSQNEYQETDVIFLDLTMPDIDGIEVITALAKRQCQVLLVLMSGFDMQILISAQQLAQEYGLNVVESLTKPMDIGHVMQLLEKIKSTL